MDFVHLQIWGTLANNKFRSASGGFSGISHDESVSTVA